MRLILFVAILLPASVLCQPKKAIPVFGKVSKEEILLKNCDFDKDAEAVVLFEGAKLYYDFIDGNPFSELRHFVRIKILTEKGLDQANIKLRYLSKSNVEGIVGLTANVYNLDEAGNIVVTKMDKKSVYQKRINAAISEQAFTMPEVKVGSVIEYKYSWRGFNNRNWTLQKAIPVVQTQYEIDFPSLYELHVRPLCSLPYTKKDESTTQRTIQFFEMKNIPALRNEQFLSCEKDYLQRIESWVVAFNYEGRRYPRIKSWTEVSTALLEDEDFGLQMKKEIPRTAELDVELKKLTDPYQKMVAVHNYVRKNMKWDGEDNYWALNGVKSAWKDKNGTSGEINLILINLLKDAGLHVDPIMVSTRENGRISPLFPDRSQFNKVLALVTIGQKTYVLDGTDKYTPAGMIPENVIFTDGMVLDPTSEIKFRFQSLWDETRTDKNVVIFQAKIDTAGMMNGHATITSADYARVKRVPQLSDRVKYMDHYFKASNASMGLDSLKLKNEELDSMPLVQDFDFHYPVNAADGYAYFTTNLFNSMGANPFISDTRFSDVFFGAKQTQMIIANIQIPDGYTFEELPKNLKMVLPDQSLSVTRMSGATGNILSTRLVVEFKRPFYTPEEYPDLKEFYKKMYTLLDEQIVIKKKTN